jgi:hypothetical protein
MMQRKARGTWRALLLARPNAQQAPNSTSPSVLAVRAAEPIEIWLWLILLLYAGTPRPISWWRAASSRGACSSALDY